MLVLADIAPGPSDPERRESVETLFERFLRTAERSGWRAPKLRDWVDLAEAWRISHALRQCRGNRSAAARSLGIGRRTLYSKMEKLGIEPVFAPSGTREDASRPCPPRSDPALSVEERSGAAVEERSGTP